jgi:hypothetical protein
MSSINSINRNQFLNLQTFSGDKTNAGISNQTIQTASQNEVDNRLADLNNIGNFNKFTVSNKPILLAQSSNAVNRVLTNKTSYQALNANQQRNVYADLSRFMKTSSYQNASQADKPKLASHIADALIYREQLKNTPNSNSFSAKSALNEVNFSLNQVISGKAKVALKDLAATTKAEYNPNTKVLYLGRNATQYDINRNSVTQQDAATIGSNGNFASDIAHEYRHNYNDNVLNRNELGRAKRNSNNDVAAGFLDEYSAQLAGNRALGIKNDGNLTKAILDKLTTQVPSFKNLYDTSGAFQSMVNKLKNSNKAYTAEEIRNELLKANFNMPFLNKKRND